MKDITISLDHAQWLHSKNKRLGVWDFGVVSVKSDEQWREMQVAMYPGTTIERVCFDRMGELTLQRVIKNQTETNEGIVVSLQGYCRERYDAGYIFTVSSLTRTYADDSDKVVTKTHSYMSWTTGDVSIDGLAQDSDKVVCFRHKDINDIEAKTITVDLDKVAAAYKLRSATGTVLGEL